MKIVVIGGDAAGMSAAAKLKRLRADSEITVYEKGSYLSYAACGLPYYLAGDEVPREGLLQRTKEQFEASGIRPFPGCEVLEVRPEARQVLVKRADTGETFADTYDRLLIATGARPVIPEAPGVGLAGVHTLKTLDDAAALKALLALPEREEITIVGGGYIGVEAAEALASNGRRVRIIQRPPVLLKNFDPEFSAMAREELERLGVDVRTGERLLALRGQGRVQAVETDKGIYPAGIVILALGVVPATEFLAGSGIALAKNGAVVVDRQMRTSLPGIYAAGDCAQVYHMIKERNDYLPLATTANKCGRMVAENLAGGAAEFPGTLGSAAVLVGALELARTGLSEAEALREGWDAGAVVVNARSKPHYYPGSLPIRLKLVYEKGSRRILGAQGGGREGVVLRIDVLATAITNRMTADEVGMLDLCYAPPFATTWDAVHVAANAVK